MKTLRCAILFSGYGGNMQNLIESLHNHRFYTESKEEVRLKIVTTLCNNPNAYGITRAQSLQIPCIIINHRDFASREAFDKQMIESLQPYEIDYVLLAGFMRILTPLFIQQFKIINIHPSFLPEHKGAHAIRDSFNSVSDYGGVSVHWVNEELDSGEIILQEKVAKLPSDTLESFESKIHTLEYDLYPRAILKALKLEPYALDSKAYTHTSPNTNPTDNKRA
ncbi:phosphoribosylglycinamide formyltransferase [Helicobacter jaachi]|uniref:Phosphoribosylglycinamide formyltransferase n=1 Tax=Helicobacter jaachi TaxID=1677920 RepID=A0A4U8T8P7_9HELI|nr:phosphoribosylglycinamide formyltransferase [Helicobacter jaachi]TLD96079.1 phosphoribosylglycinamide formyltransferase [Helicobacter jaachi]